MAGERGVMAITNILNCRNLDQIGIDVIRELRRVSSTLTPILVLIHYLFLLLVNRLNYALVGLQLRLLLDFLLAYSGRLGSQLLPLILQFLRYFMQGLVITY